MDEELNYAEMLEIPVETVTVNRKEKKHVRETETAEEEGGEVLQQQLVEQVNDRVSEEESDPAFAQSKPIEREEKPAKPRAHFVKRLLLGEFIAVCALCATIFLTNIFMTNSAMNTFVRGLFNGKSSTADARTYSDFTLTSVVNDYTDAEITVSNTGVMSFTAKCSVYPPCDGTITAINGNETTGYTISLKHSDSFSSIISGIDTVYCAEGDKVKSNLPIAYTNGEGSVHVMFYSGDSLLNCYSVGEGGIAWN